MASPPQSKLVLIQRIYCFSSLQTSTNCNFLEAKVILQRNYYCANSKCAAETEPKELGIPPVKLLPAKFRMSSLRKCIKQLGRCPDKRLSERSRKFKIPPLILQTDEAVPEKRFSAILKTVILGGKTKRCSRPSNRLPLISRYCKVGGRSKNHLGILSEIPVSEISRIEMFHWVRSQLGNLGPSLQFAKYMTRNWKGGTQLKFNSRARELFDKSKNHKLDKFDRWTSVTTPCKELKEISNCSSWYRFPIPLGTAPVILLDARYNGLRTEILRNQATIP